MKSKDIHSKESCCLNKLFPFHNMQGLNLCDQVLALVSEVDCTHINASHYIESSDNFEEIDLSCSVRATFPSLL